MIFRLQLEKAGAPTSGVNEELTLFSGADTIQTVTLTNAPTGGTFTLALDTEVTAALAFNVAAADVQTALEGLANIGAGNVTVAGAAGGPFTVTFTGDLAATKRSGFDVALLVGDGALLTGAGDQPAVDVVYAQANPNGGTFTLSYDGNTTDPLAFDISPTDLQAAVDGIFGAGNAIVNGAAALFEEELTIDFLNALGGVDVGPLTADDTLLTVPAGCSPAATTITETTKGVLGDYRGCPRGSVLIDTTGCKLYVNTGTPYAPAWTAYPVT